MLGSYLVLQLFRMWYEIVKTLTEDTEIQSVLVAQRTTHAAAHGHHPNPLSNNDEQNPTITRMF